MSVGGMSVDGTPTDGVIWHQADSGSGEPVLFVHAATGTADSWAPQRGAFRAAGYRTIAVDRAAAGRSGPGTGDRVADLRAVLARVGVGRAHVVGHAAGGGDALGLAVRYPTVVRSLVLTNTAAGLADGPVPAMLQRLWTPGVLALPPHERELSAAYRATDDRGTAAWSAVQARAGVAAGRREASTRHDDLARVSCPVLLVCGDGDLLTPLPVMRAIADAIAGSRLVVVPDSGHASAWERSRCWNEAVLEFLASVAAD